MNKLLFPIIIAVYYSFFLGSQSFIGCSDETINDSLKRVSDQESKDDAVVDNYCVISDNTGLATFNQVPIIISSVNFAGINNIQDPNNFEGSIQQYFLEQEASVLIGHSYDIKLKGNNGGSFLNDFIVCIDWNDNGILTDNGEKYRIRSPYFSEAKKSIAVPSNVLPGKARMRIIRVNPYVSDDMVGFYVCNAVAFETFQFQDYIINILPADNNLSVNNSEICSTVFSVFPNPVEDFLYIKSKEKVENISISDMSGRIIFTSQVGNEQKVNLSALSEGVYNAGIKTKSGYKTIKLMKK